jgi:hypothetical protein
MIKVPNRLKGQSPAHARSRTQEKTTAVRIGGKVTKGSGSGNEQGDVRLRGFMRVEAKTTSRKSFSVTAELIEKLEAATFGSGEVPVMQIELELGKHKVVVMPDWALDLIVEALKVGHGKG